MKLIEWELYKNIRITPINTVEKKEIQRKRMIEKQE